MKKSFVAPDLLLFLLIMVLAACTRSEEASPATASDLLARLPATIFEATTEGMSEQEKQRLHTQGEAGSWKITAQDNERLTISDTNNADTIVRLHVYNAKGTHQLVAVHITNARNSQLDFWQYTPASQQLIHVGLSSDFWPQLTGNDFLAPEQQLPDAYQATLVYSMNDDGAIDVEPHTWMEEAFEERELIYTVRLTWDGEKFRVGKSAIAN